LYADDLILLSASVSGLQRCLNIVFFALVWNFNSNLIVKNRAVLPSVQDITNAIHLFNLVLSSLDGTQLLSIWALFSVLELLLNVDTDVISRKFYAACNSIYSRTSGLTDLTKLHLMESYCLPLLTYALVLVHLI